MCRWITVLSSDPMSLSDIVLAPCNSLIQLSKDASFHPGSSELNNHVTNGDGFGVGWYHSFNPYIPSPQPIKPTTELVPPTVISTTSLISSNGATNIKNQSPTTTLVSGGDGDDDSTGKKIKCNHANALPRLNAAVFKDTQPAWNNANLRELCLAVQSHCVVAHVRAASVFAGISQQNCHPFKAGRLMFCHNGRIEQFDLVRRKFHALLSDEAFINIKGTTDSEVLFALLCSYLTEDSYVSPFHQSEPFGHDRLTTALKRVLRTIENLTENAGITKFGYCTCNFALTDGETMVVTRFCDKSPSIPPPSLYFAFGDSTKLYDELTQEQIPDVIGGSGSVSTPPRPFNKLCSTVSDDSSQRTASSAGSVGSGNNGRTTSSGNLSSEGDSTDFFDENMIDVENWDSKPGTVYADIDLNRASFIVASCPLTRTHTWHAMPKNSIMWYTRGSLPELRILKRRKATRSFIFSETM